MIDISVGVAIEITLHAKADTLWSLSRLLCSGVEASVGKRCSAWHSITRGVLDAKTAVADVADASDLAIGVMAFEIGTFVTLNGVDLAHLWRLMHDLILTALKVNTELVTIELVVLAN